MNLDLHINIRSVPPESCCQFTEEPDGTCFWRNISLKEIGRYSKKYNILVGYIRCNYYWMNEITNNKVVGQINVLKDIELCPPKWIKRLIE